MSNPVSVGDDLVARLQAGIAYEYDASENRMVSDISGIDDLMAEAAFQLAAVTAERDALRGETYKASAEAAEYHRDNAITMWHAAEAQLKAAREALERKQDMLETLVSFVHRWTWLKEGNGTSDRERLEVIKHYPPIAALNPKAPS